MYDKTRTEKEKRCREIITKYIQEAEVIQRSAENTSEDTTMKPLTKLGRSKTSKVHLHIAKSAMDTHQKYESFTCK